MTAVPAGVEKARGGRFPWQLGVAVAAWVVLGVLLVMSGLNPGPSANEADQASVDQIRNALGDTAVAAHSAGHPTLLLLAGFAILLLSLLLLIGQGWARHVLALAGVAAVILFALGGRWETLVAFAALVIGTVPLLAPSAHRYLT